jgi:SAM-dependent methyltransferase
MTFEDEWRERFSEFAEERDDDAGIAGWSATGLAARVRHFRALWRPRAAGLWLDAGCGAGTYMRVLAGQGQQVVGADYSWPTLKKCSTALSTTGPVLVADVRRLPFASATFDGVLCLGVVQALADSRPAVIELSRLLAPDGELWMDGLNAASLVHIIERACLRLRGKRGHLRHESPAALRRLLVEQGLVDVRLHWMPIAPGRFPGLQRMFESRAFRVLLAVLPPLGALVSHAFIVRGRRQFKANDDRAVKQRARQSLRNLTSDTPSR